MNTSVPATGNKGKRSGTAVRAKGQRRVADILAAAQALLIEEGYTQFSLRNIAGRAGIHLSNLQYYFPGKDELIHGLMEFIARAYGEKFDELFSRLPLDPEARFEAVIEYLIADTKKTRTRRLSIQLWALLESSDAYSGVLLDELYALHINMLSTLIRAINPELSQGNLHQRATMIVAMLEGMLLTIRVADMKLLSDESGIEEELKKQIIRMALDD